MRLLEAIETNNETNNVSEHNMIQQAVAYFYAVDEAMSSGLLKTIHSCQGGTKTCDVRISSLVLPPRG